MHTYYDVKEMLKNELDEIVKKGELSAGSLETIDKILNSIKNSCKIIMYEEYSEDGYSYADGDADMSDYAYARTSGRGRGSNARRDSMGRYSSRGYSRRGRYSYDDGDKQEKMDMLREMMKDASSDEERRALNKIIRRMETD